MATVEGLFNFDEKLLARQVVKNRDSAAIGANAPAGWGPMMMGMNKIGNAIFNTDDKILREQTIAQTSLKETMDMLGEDANDSAKLYDALGQRLVENGASAETLMKLKSVASQQAQAEAKTAADIEYKKEAQALRQTTLELQNKYKSDAAAAKERKMFESATTDPNSVIGQTFRDIMKKLTGGADRDKTGYKMLQQTLTEYIYDAINEGSDVSNAMRIAVDRLEKSYEYKPDKKWFGDDSALVPITPGTSNSVETESPAFLELLERNRTK